MPSVDEAIQEEARRVYGTVRAAAADALESGRAGLKLTAASEVYEGAQYDCPVVLLTPANLAAATVLVEVQQPDVWWLMAGDGPGTEFYPRMERDRHEQLGALVRAVVNGRYSDGPVQDTKRGIFRARALSGWGATFEAEDGPFTSRHFGKGTPEARRQFAAY